MAANTRLNRQNTAKQVQLKKRHDLVSAVKLFGGVDGAPRIVAVLPLCPDVNAQDAVKSMVESFDGPTDDVPSIGIHKMRCAIPHSTASRHMS